MIGRMTLPDLFEKTDELVGKKVQDSDFLYWGVFWGISSGDCWDYYYVIQKDNKDIVLLSVETELSLYEG